MNGAAASVDQKDYTRDYYELDLARYESRHTFSLTRIKRVLDFLEPCATDIVADIGCGVGTFSLELASRVRRVYSIDFSQDALDILERMKEKRGYENIIPIRSSVDDIHLHDRAVDTIISADLIEHLYEEQFQKFICECRRILRPGGHMIIYTPNIVTDFKRRARRIYGPAKNIFCKVPGIRRESAPEGRHDEEYEYLHVGYRSVDDIVSALTKNEFFVESTRYFETPVPFPLSGMEFVRKNFAKRYLIKCKRKQG